MLLPDSEWENQLRGQSCKVFYEELNVFRKVQNDILKSDVTMRPIGKTWSGSQKTWMMLQESAQGLL